MAPPLPAGSRISAMERRLDSWLRKRSFQSALLGGGLSFALIICLLSFAANAYFMVVRNAADKLRWQVSEVEAAVLRMNAADSRFLLKNASAAENAADTSEHAALLAAADKLLQRGIDLARGDLRTGLEQAAAGLQQYDTQFALLEKVARNGGAALLGEGELERQTATLMDELAQIKQRAAASSDFARNAMAITTGAVALASVVLAGFFLYWFAGSLTRPLQQLAAAASSIGAGQLDTRVSYESVNELGALAQSFNRMADALATLVSKVQRSTIQVATSVNDIAATSKQQQATASEIAATTLEIGATSREITATARELLHSVSEVSRVAEESASLAGTGRAGLDKMEGTMQRVAEASGQISTKLGVLNEKAANIGQVIVTITKVADQTNLLSLNAAIEAEKAGEYGRGFSVVATEIRRLADQTAVATYDIEQMVKEIQSAVAASVMGMDRFADEVRRGLREVQQVGAQFQQIIQHVQALAPRFEQVNEGMQAQSTGAEQITQALTQLNEAAQQTVESLRQSTQAIDGLHQVSGGLRGSISQFRLDTAG
ncbi:MAG TPA: methyl-accepting chemotaxis protein [Candidatus Binatia bacterium]|nr:methyl-accepting chemotaxis protein [Candidatus Binatia bacterium]